MAPERIKRHDDERFYQLRIHSRRICELHRISEEIGEPVTVPVDQALHEFMERQSSGDDQSEADDEEQEDRSDGTGDQSHFVTLRDALSAIPGFTKLLRRTPCQN